MLYWGQQKNSNFDNTTVIVGSGSYDPMGGIVFSKKWGELTLQGSGLFKRTTNGFHGNYYGNLSVQNISLSYRIMGENDFCSLDTSTKMKSSKMGLSVSAGYYGEWLDKIREDNIVDDNSGHYLGFANLGGVLSYKKWGFPLTVSLPIINNMNGQQNDAGVRLRVGIIKAF